MKYIKDYKSSLKGKNILVRIDVNEPVDEKGYPQDNFRIAKALQTISFLRQSRAKIVLIAHLGNPQKDGREGLSLALIAEVLGRLGGFDIRFISEDIKDLDADNIINSMSEGEIVFLENLRFDEREEENSFEFAKILAQFGYWYVNDAFSVMHRRHSSVVAITEILPSFGGLVLEQELEALNRILHNPTKPAVAIIGGAKIETKLPVIRALESSFDYILVGGKVANEYIDEYKKSHSDKIILPVDFVDKDRYDIGPKTRKLFASHIDKASTLVWNGPMGWFEKTPYDEGTRFIAQAIAKNESSYSVIGGGETVDEVHNLHQESKIDFISTGGGAMLEYISNNGKLAGIEALDYNSTPLKIAVHASHLCQEREDGNQTYILNLFQAIRDLDEKNHYIFYYNKPKSRRVEAPNFEHKVNQAPWMWTQRVFPFLLRRDKPDVLFMPIQMLPFLKAKKQKSVVTIHDLAFLLYPETFPAKDAFLHKLYVREAITKADHLIAITEATKQDIIKFYNTDSDKITVVYHGVNKDRFRLMQEGEEHLVADVKSKYNITKPYILYIGNVQPRKNIQGLIKAYQQLRKTTEHNYQLVIAGAKAWLVEDVMKEIGDAYRDDIIFTGRFQDEELPPLLWGADIFVLPSFYEGFGLPILEAMACGVPTLVSNTPSLVEVGGEASRAFDPHSVDDMAKVLDNVLSDSSLRQDMRDQGLKRAAEFSWERCAKETIQVIKEVNAL